MHQPITPGRICWVTLNNQRVRVRMIHQVEDAAPNTWECELIRDGKRLELMEADDWNLEPATWMHADGDLAT